MNRILTVLLALAMVLSVTGPAMALADEGAASALDGDRIAQTDEAANETAENATVDLPPGAMLAGSIGVHHEEMQGEIEHRSFGLQIAAAATNDSQARILNRTQDRLQERLMEMDREMTRLNESLANGTVSQSQYQVRMSRLVVRSRNVERLANSTSWTAATLPAETLAANGVNVTALERIRTHARNMSGPKTAAIARQIAGDTAGAPMGPPENVPRGPPESMPGNQHAGDAGNDTRMGPGNGPPDGTMGPPTTQQPTENGTVTTQNQTATTDRGPTAGHSTPTTTADEAGQ
jgi:hypothetical protein